MTAKLSLDQRTFSASEFERPVAARTFSALELRKKSDPEPLILPTVSPPTPRKKRSFRKVSNPPPPFNLTAFANTLPETEKSQIEKIQETAKNPTHRLILLRQWIENLAIRDLVAPEKSWERSNGYLEIYMLPTPDILSFPLDEASRPLTSGDLHLLQFAMNGRPIVFQEEDEADTAILKILHKAGECGWVFKENESPAQLTADILKNERTKISRLLQAASMNARGDAIAFLIQECSHQDCSLEQLKDAFNSRILHIDFFIHSKDLFTVLHYQPFKISKKKQTAEFEVHVAVTYDHGHWKSSLYITDIKGDLFPAFKKLQDLSKDQRHPRKHPLTRKSKPLPDLANLLLDVRGMKCFPHSALYVESIEELYVLNETFITNRPIHQKIAERIPIESMRALKTLSTAKSAEQFSGHNKEKAASKYLKSENFFNEIDKLLWQKIGADYRVECELLNKKLKTYKEAEDYFTKTISVLVKCMKKSKELWTCHMHGAVTYQHHQWTVHTLLTNFSVIRKMRRLEPLFIEYEKACIPVT